MRTVLSSGTPLAKRCNRQKMAPTSLWRSGRLPIRKAKGFVLSQLWTAVNQRTEALSTPWQASSQRACWWENDPPLTILTNCCASPQARCASCTHHLRGNVARGFDTRADTVRPAAQHESTPSPLCARAWGPLGHKRPRRRLKRDACTWFGPAWRCVGVSCSPGTRRHRPSPLSTRSGSSQPTRQADRGLGRGAWLSASDWHSRQHGAGLQGYGVVPLDRSTQAHGWSVCIGFKCGLRALRPVWHPLGTSTQEGNASQTGR